MLPPAKVEVPVPTLKVLEPVTLVLPFRLTAPVPVPKVLAPVWEKAPATVVLPVTVRVPFMPMVSVLSPIVMVSASALVPILMVSQLAELHKETLVALVLPMLIAAPESRVRAPTVVVREEAALPVSDTAPPVTVKPAEPVNRALKVLAPPKVWEPVSTRPGLVISAQPKVSTLEAI